MYVLESELNSDCSERGSIDDDLLIQVRSNPICLLKEWVFYFSAQIVFVSSGQGNLRSISNSWLPRPSIENKQENLFGFWLSCQLQATSSKRVSASEPTFSFFLFQPATGDQFLDEFLSNDASLDDGAVPDIKVIDSSINMTANEVRPTIKGDLFLNQVCHWGQGAFTNAHILTFSDQMLEPLEHIDNGFSFSKAWDRRDKKRHHEWEQPCLLPQMGLLGHHLSLDGRGLACQVALHGTWVGDGGH